MRNFLRCLRMAWPYRGRLALSLVCAAMAAACWSLNLLALHPALKIIGGAPSLPASVQSEIDELERDTLPHRTNLERFRTELASTPADEANARIRLTAQIDRAQFKVLKANVTLARLRWLQKFYSRCFPDDRFATLVWLMGVFVSAIAMKGFFEFWQESLVGSAAARTILQLRTRLFGQAIRQDPGRLGETGAHDLTSRLTNDTEVLSGGLKTVFGRVVSEPLRAMCCIVVACFISWRLAAVFLVLVPLGLYAMTRFGHSMKRASKRLMERMSDLHRILKESFHGIRVVKAFTMEPYERLRFREAARELFSKSTRIVYIDAIAGPVIEVMGVTGIAIAILAGGYLVLKQRTDLFGIRMTDYPLDHETLLTFYALLAAIADPVRKLSSVYTKLHSAAAAADRIVQESDRRPRISRNGTAPRLPLHEHSITFENVSFAYDADRPILRDINLEVFFGETIAVVGRNGCGKSTLLNLLPRFHDPDTGLIRVDGVDIRTANLRSLLRQIAVVTQETILFDDTIANNIAYGRRRASREEIEAAARQAHAHEFIETLPRGYETRAGDLARALSGGEKQRIALARAILRNPRILLLDEFSSQIDAESEAHIQGVLKEFMRGRTTFMVTHRLNTLEMADRILVLDGGRIQAIGSHAKLLATSAVYRSLHEAHFERRAAG